MRARADCRRGHTIVLALERPGAVNHDDGGKPLQRGGKVRSSEVELDAVSATRRAAGGQHFDSSVMGQRAANPRAEVTETAQYDYPHP